MGKPSCQLAPGHCSKSDMHATQEAEEHAARSTAGVVACSLSWISAGVPGGDSGCQSSWSLHSDVLLWQWISRWHVCAQSTGWHWQVQPPRDIQSGLLPPHALNVLSELLVPAASQYSQHKQQQLCNYSLSAKSAQSLHLLHCFDICHVLSNTMNTVLTTHLHAIDALDVMCRLICSSCCIASNALLRSLWTSCITLSRDFRQQTTAPSLQ